MARYVLGSTVLLVATLFSRAALADDPSYKFAEKEEIKKVVWKASAQAGVILTSGNSSTVSMSGALLVSRNDGWNKVTLDAAGAYAQSQVRTPTDADGNKIIDGTEARVRTSQTTAAAWLAKARYDRFFTEKNSMYLSAFLGQDTVAGNTLLAGGQSGYSRLLVKNAMNELAAEVGYDFSYLQFSDPASAPVVIHSARLFVGYVLTLSKTTAIVAAVEGLFNGNPVEVGPKDDPGTHHGPLEAFRINGKVGLTTQLYKNIAFKFGFALKYNNAPAPITLAAPMGTTLMDKLVVRAEKLDTVTEAAVVVTFL